MNDTSIICYRYKCNNKKMIALINAALQNYFTKTKLHKILFLLKHNPKCSTTPLHFLMRG